MAEYSTVELRKVIDLRNALEKYQDDLYLNQIKKLNTQCDEILKKDLGSQFVMSCGRDLAGEVVRNCFNTSDFYITVDQLAERIFKFEYDNDYDPLNSQAYIHKNVYNYNEVIPSDRINSIIKDMDDNQKKLFEKIEKEYVDKGTIKKGKSEYVKNRTEEDGKLFDELTGEEGEYITDKNGKRYRRLEVDHIQATATAKYNEKYIKNDGVNKLKEVYNSADNFQMMLKNANGSKGDVKVLDKHNNDITHRATPEEYVEAIAKRWQNTNENTKQILKEKGYLNEEGKVSKNIKRKLIKNVKNSQNAESKVILKNAEYNEIGKDAFKHTKNSIVKIIAGQIIYYSAPPLIFEVRNIIQDKPTSIKQALSKLGASAKRIGEYIFSKLKDIFKNVLVSSLKNFIKIFMDILINMIKATVKKMLKFTKNIILSTVDAIKIIATKGASPAKKADGVCNLYALTMTTFVVDILFELINKGLNLPEFLIMPLQILATVVCTNFTMLVLQEADLFNVRTGFKMSALRKLFEESREELTYKSEFAEKYILEEIELIMKWAMEDSKEIYQNLIDNNPYESNIKESLQRVIDMFGMKTDLEQEWLKFTCVEPL